MTKYFGKFAVTLAVLGILVLGIAAGRFWEAGRHKEPALDSSAVTARLQEISSLSAAELEYRGLVRYSDGDIPLLTQKSFTMIYDAHIKAGIDVSQIQADASQEQITITLPHATVQDINIDPDSLEFYDEKFALFNFQNRNDTVTALQYAAEDAQEHAADTDLLSAADERIQTLISSFLTTLFENEKETPEIVFEMLPDKTEENSAA